MKVNTTSLEGVRIVEPDAYEDNRGFFMETYQEKRYRDLGIKVLFVQDNLSFSVKGTLRGLHYQLPHQQSKLVQVIMGEVFDVAVDIRRGSPTFGKWTFARLSQRNRRQLFVPVGFAHGFCVLSETAYVSYKCSDYYSPENERGLLWSDPDLGIDWPLKALLLSVKDNKYACLKDIPGDLLPDLWE